MMTNQVSDLEDSKVVLFRRNASAVPRQRRAGVDERRGQVLTTKVGLQMPAGLTFEDWERAGRQLSGIVNSSSWWLGDWLVYGKDHYTDRYQRGIRAAGLQYQTLRNYAWVSRRFDFSRRRAALSFQHHAELASLPIDEQELWLDRAEQMQWTTKQLRSAIRVAREDEARDGNQTPETMRRLAVPGSRLQWWHKAAEQSGIDFEQWVLATLDNAAERALVEDEAAARKQAGLSA
ncbi:LmbU family transcriptional regulator [Streptomyces flavofungini]|uniref:LmbU family transcriptional regulator n=1 Tax=Streptomyces flavofungini TaxID=68200 RepID=A0ABS0X1U5_9ACTN|nr:LmbU family transcriptional regulator [Streptomyces flavofungini]MBJ3807159.1 LmbU family transcriptional regulator [Streptomyces flavofungini]